jgi:hypothetical protein
VKRFAFAIAACAVVTACAGTGSELSSDVPVSTASTQPPVTIVAGTPCQSEGKLDQGFECRQSVDGPVWVSTSSDGYRVDTYGDDAVCKLPDRRPESKGQGMVIGFPLSLSGVPTPSVGTITLAAVAVDFPDYQGSPAELATLRKTAENIDEWLENESDGRVSAEWQFHEQWITMSKPAAEYRVQGFGVQPYQALSTEIVDRVLEVMELRELDELFVYFPNSITSQDQDLEDPFESILPQIGIPEREIRQFNGSRLHNLKGSGTISRRNGNVLWAIWAHELLHTFGLQVHGPHSSGLIDTVSNTTFTVSAWSRWLLGWLDDAQVACVDPTNGPVEVDLVPLQLVAPSDAIRAAIVPLTETTALLIESHRSVGYGASKGFGQGTGIGRTGVYGIVAYVLDSAEKPEADPTTEGATSGTRFIASEALVSGDRGAFGSFADPNAPFQPLTYLGERIVEAGHTIEFIRTSGFDTVVISKN